MMVGGRLQNGVEILMKVVTKILMNKLLLLETAWNILRKILEAWFIVKLVRPYLAVRDAAKVKRRCLGM